MSKAVTPTERARAMIALQGSEETSVLYWLLKVAVPQIRGGRMVERRGCVGGIFVFEMVMVCGAGQRVSLSREGM